MKGYSCQCITHVGCCIKRKPRENNKVCVNVLPTSYRQVTDTLPTVGRLSAHCRPTGSLYFRQNLSAVCRPTVGRRTADSRPTVGRQLTNSQPTGFLGSSSSQLPIQQQILQTNSQGNVQQLETRIKNWVLGVKGLSGLDNTLRGNRKLIKQTQ